MHNDPTIKCHWFGVLRHRQSAYSTSPAPHTCGVKSVSHICHYSISCSPTYLYHCSTHYTPNLSPRATNKGQFICCCSKSCMLNPTWALGQLTSVAIPQDEHEPEPLGNLPLLPFHKLYAQPEPSVFPLISSSPWSLAWPDKEEKEIVN